MSLLFLCKSNQARLFLGFDQLFRRTKTKSTEQTPKFVNTTRDQAHVHILSFTALNTGTLYSPRNCNVTARHCFLNRFTCPPDTFATIELFSAKNRDATQLISLQVTNSRSAAHPCNKNCKTEKTQNGFTYNIKYDAETQEEENSCPLKTIRG